MSNKSRADLNIALTEALITGGRRTTALGVKNALTDILDSLAVFGEMHVLGGETAQSLTTTYTGLTGMTTVGQSLGTTVTVASGQITPAVAGIYRLDVRLRCVGVAATTYSIRVLVNGVAVTYLADEYLTTDTESFLLVLTGFVQTSAPAQNVILQGKSSEGGGADLTIVQGSYTLQRIQ